MTQDDAEILDTVEDPKTFLNITPKENTGALTVTEPLEHCYLETLLKRIVRFYVKVVTSNP